MEGSSNKMDKRFIYSILLFIAIVLIDATLRSPISSVGPLVPFFTEELNISNTMVGFMNTLPLVAFGLFSPFSLAIMFFVLRTRTVEDSYSLSGMAQHISLR